MASCTFPRIHALPLDVPRIFALVSGRKQGRVKRGERASERERRKSGGARRRANAAAHRRRRSQFYRRGAIGGSHGPWYLGIARARELDGLPVVGTFVPRRRPALVACARAYLAYAHTPTHVRTHGMASTKRKQDERNLKTLRELVSQPGNKECFDCNQRGPTYVNMTIGSFVCTSCSGML